MESDSKYPDWLHDAVYEDSIFAAAYDAVSSPQRALLKTCIARLYDWYAPGRATNETVCTQWRQGFSSTTQTIPRKRCAVLLDDAVGPAALLAGLMPARALGVCEVAVVFLGNSMPSAPVLAALELAGQELVMPAGDQLSEILALHTGPAACVLALGGTGAACHGHQGPIWHGPTKRTITVCMDQDSPIDMDALAFAHPEAELTVVDGLEDVSESNQAIFTSPFLAEEALKHSGLVLGPGHEGCWLYPGLASAFFLSQKIAII